MFYNLSSILNCLESKYKMKMNFIALIDSLNINCETKKRVKDNSKVLANALGRIELLFAEADKTQNSWA